MRWLLRLIIFWAICAPISYFYGIPALMEYMTNKVRTDSYNQCMTHMNNEKLIGSESSPFNQQQGETYCRCVSSPLTFTKDDLLDVIQKIPPKAITAQATALTPKCNAELQQSVAPPAQVTPVQPAPAQPSPAPSSSELIVIDKP